MVPPVADRDTAEPIAAKPLRGLWGRLLATALLAGASIGLFGDVAKWFVSPAISRTLVSVDENFTEGLLLRPDWVAVSGFVPCRDGWCLAPGTSGSLRYHPRVSLDRVGDLQLYLWIYAPAGVTNRVLVSGDGGRTFRPLGTDVRAAGTRFGLGSQLGGPQGPVLLFEASNATGALVLVLDKITLTYLDTPLDAAPSRLRFLLAFLSFGAAGVTLCRRCGVAAGSLAIVALGAVLRYGLLTEVLATPLDPDSQGYRAYAGQMAPFTDRGFYSARVSAREPFFVFVTHVWFRLVGDSDFHMRLVSFGLAIVLLWVVLRVGTSLFGVELGWLTGLMIALDRPFAMESISGLRLELETILFLLSLGCAFVWPRPRGLPGALVLGVLGGLLVLTRSTYLGVMIVVQASAQHADRRLRWDWLKPAAVSVAVMILLVLPHRYEMYRAHGDPFWDTSRYARWIANFEFAGRPGFLGRDQLELDGYAGPRISYAQYMFGMHSVAELVTGTLRGYLGLSARLTECPWRGGWWPCGPFATVFRTLAVVGFVLALTRRDRRWLPIAFVAVEFPVAFLYDRGLLDDRHILSSLPLVLFAAAGSLSWAAAGLARARRPPC